MEKVKNLKAPSCQNAYDISCCTDNMDFLNIC